MELNKILHLTESTISEMDNQKLQEALQSITREQAKIKENIYLKGSASSSDNRLQDQLTRIQGQCMSELSGRGIPVTSSGTRRSGADGQNFVEIGYGGGI